MRCLLKYDKHNPPPLVLATLEACALPKSVRKQVKPNQAETVLYFMEATTTITGSRPVCRLLASMDEGSAFYPATDPVAAAEVDQWLDWAAVHAATDPCTTALGALNAALRMRTYLVGHDLTLADVAVFLVLQRASVRSAAAKLAHVQRWQRWIAAQPAVQPAVQAQAAKEKPKAAAAAPRPGGKHSKLAKVKVGAKGKFGHALAGAEKGKVVTRFPPEPSGYMHLGHCKAILLNSMYAKMWEGSLIFRLDDTNPAKEKAMYTESMLKDVERLQVPVGKVTHTSDSFELILQTARKMIESGHAYVDDTPREQMSAERDEGIESRHRNNTVEQNLQMWDEMLQATPLGQQCVLRAKLDTLADGTPSGMKNPNKALRDPALARCLDMPHDRTGDKYKVYPLYDLAVAIVDCVEGVTHALRDSQYHDRIELYRWVQHAAGFTGPHILEFARLNFQYTILSKRKLQWFVDEGIVPSWDDPSFPTVAGILRRGMSVEALSLYIESQGASMANTCQEMNKLWDLNKKIIDPIVPRFTGIPQDSKVLVTLSDAMEVSSKEVAAHPKNADVGMKTVWFTPKLWLEAEDAATLSEGEEITLMGWGNIVIESLSSDGITAKLHLDGDFKATKKKLTWLPAHDTVSLTPVIVSEYDTLLNKAILEKDDDWKEFINRTLRYDTAFLCDPNVATLKQGDRCQLMRRGYFICDGTNDDGTIVLIKTPDGKTGGPSILSCKVKGR